MSYRVELVMEVEPGRGAEFEEAWLAVGRHVAAHPANLAQWLARDEEGRYVIVSDWPDEAAFRAFEVDPEHRAVTGRLRSLRVAGSMTGMTVLHHLVGAGAR